jgi:hypothetical protein
MEGEMNHRRPGLGRRASVVGAALLMAVTMISGCAGQNYSCGTPDVNHCYGTVKWTGSPTGLSMEETPVLLTSGDIFIDDESWLIDYGTSADLDNTSWVETGEWNQGSGTDYFWAYSTGGDSGFMSYPLGAVAQSDTKGAWIAYQIRADPKTPSQWDVTISRAASGEVLYAPPSPYVPMTPNTVLEGQELAGEQDAQAPLAFFSENEVFQGSAETLRTADGTVTDGKPPNAGWLGTDTPSNTSDGGMFFTDCC